jgi:hypothetical protein
MSRVEATLFRAETNSASYQSQYEQFYALEKLWQRLTLYQFDFHRST